MWLQTQFKFYPEKDTPKNVQINEGNDPADFDMMKLYHLSQQIKRKSQNQYRYTWGPTAGKVW